MRRWEALVLGWSVAALAGWATAKYAGGPATGVMTVNVDPADAIVIVDNEKVGDRSPVTVERRPGSYTLSVSRDGYTREDQMVEVVPGRATTVKVALEASPDTGFELTSDPPGMRVWLDDAPVRGSNGEQARTNFRASRIKPGHHLLVLQNERFKDWRNDIEIEAGMIRKVHAVMVPGP